MIRRTLLFSVAYAVSLAAAVPQKPPAPQRPKLILGIMIDQFRYDYFTRFRSEYNAGFAAMYERGAVFTSAYLDHIPTVTAIGHATFLSGATPAISGIVGNDWYDRAEGKRVTSVNDDTVQLLGGRPGAAGASPRRLLVTTVGDELKLASRGKSKVIGISSKDRAAILPAGHMADGAYWFDEETGNFVSSTFYFNDLPGWVKDFNAARHADKYLKAVWTPLVPQPDWPAFSRKMTNYASLEASPYSNELVEALAERAIDAERLGQRGVIDVLTVSFSANDYVGHDAGPYAPEVRDISIRTDRVIGKLLSHIQSRLGPSGAVVVMTADHGVAPLPEAMREQRGPGGRLPSKDVLAAVEAALDRAFGEGQWVIGSNGPDPYFNRALIREKKLDEVEVGRVAAEAVRALPHVFRVYTRDQMVNSHVGFDHIARRALNGFYDPRAADLVTIEDPYWMTAGGRGTTHGSPWNYDSHLPLVIMGPAIKPGTYRRNVVLNDVAPTLSSILGIQAPGGSVGRVLDEIFAR